MWIAKRTVNFLLLCFFTLTCLFSVSFNLNRLNANKFFSQGDLYGAYLTDSYDYRYAYALGTRLLIENKVKEAIFYLEKTVKLHPNYSDAYNNLAVAYFKDHQYQKAIGLTDEAFRRWPNHGILQQNKVIADDLKKRLKSGVKKTS